MIDLAVGVIIERHSRASSTAHRRHYHADHRLLPGLKGDTKLGNSIIF